LGLCLTIHGYLGLAVHVLHVVPRQGERKLGLEKGRKIFKFLMVGMMIVVVVVMMM